MQAGVAAGALVIILMGVVSRGGFFSRTPLDGAVLIMLAAISLSLWFAYDQPFDFHAATSFWVVGSYYVTWYFLDTETTLKKCVAGMILLASLASVFAVYQSMTGDYPLGSVIHPQVDVLLKPVPDMDGRVGGVGLFFSRLTLAHMLLFPFCWIAALLLEPVGLKTKLGLVVAFVCVSAGLVFTWTRAAWLIACLAGLVLVVARLRNHTKICIVTGAVVLGLVAGAFWLSPTMRDRMTASFAGGRDWGRLTLWQTALDLASEKPITGHGYGSFQNVAGQRIEQRLKQMGKKRFSGIIAWAHNNLLTFLAQTGVIGAFAFCFLFVLYFKGALKALRSMCPDQHFMTGFIRGSMAAVATFLAAGLFHDTFFDGEVVFCLWFTMAASLAGVRLAHRPGNPSTC